MALSDAHRSDPVRAAILAAIVGGFERALGLTLVPGELSAVEAELAAELLARDLLPSDWRTAESEPEPRVNV